MCEKLASPLELRFKLSHVSHFARQQQSTFSVNLTKERTHRRGATDVQKKFQGSRPQKGGPITSRHFYDQSHAVKNQYGNIL